jgi:hypothetical protein
LDEETARQGVADLSKDDKKEIRKRSRKAVADQYMEALEKSGAATRSYDDDDAWTLAQAIAAARTLKTMGFSIEDLD